MTTPAAPPDPAPQTAALESLHAGLWRASSLGSCSSASLPSGFAALDALLPGGGWPTRCLTEIIGDDSDLLEWRLLAPALGSLFDALPQAAPKRQSSVSRPLLLINPPHHPHLPGLQACGLQARPLVWVAPATTQQQLWALEQAIKSNAAAALLVWLPQARPEQIRRLQCCAQGFDAPIFLFRPWSAQQQASSAPLRLLLKPAGNHLQLQILKRRGPASALLLNLPAMPAGLGRVLTPAMLARGEAGPANPPIGIALEPRHALARLPAFAH